MNCNELTDAGVAGLAAGLVVATVPGGIHVDPLDLNHNELAEEGAAGIAAGLAVAPAPVVAAARVAGSASALAVLSLRKNGAGHHNYRPATKYLLRLFPPDCVGRPTQG